MNNSWNFNAGWENTSMPLVLSNEIYVSLSPLEDYCGLPKLLRHAELWRDMLAQDIVLKYFTCSILHPSTPLGKSFWG
jgi:hypothetical protein